MKNKKNDTILKLQYAIGAIIILSFLIFIAIKDTQAKKVAFDNCIQTQTQNYCFRSIYG